MAMPLLQPATLIDHAIQTDEDTPVNLQQAVFQHHVPEEQEGSLTAML